jgi:hypothetical protein
MAFALSTAIKRKFAPEKAAQMMKFVAFPSSVVASCTNCYIMRRSEIPAGANIVDKDGVLLAEGKRSSVAAKQAVHDTVFSRGLLSVPVFVVPALAMSLPPIAAALAASPAMVLPFATGLTIVAFGLGLYGAPSTTHIPLEDAVESRAFAPLEALHACGQCHSARIVTFSYHLAIRKVRITGCSPNTNHTYQFCPNTKGLLQSLTFHKLGL